MSSRFPCVCGELLLTNLACGGAGVYRLIRDEQWDTLPDDSGPDAATRLFLQGHETLRCPQCHRLIVFWNRTDAPTVYSPGEYPKTMSLSEIDTAAVARGFLDAAVDAEGDVRCPHCQRLFNTKSSDSWDGLRHQTCGTFLRLTARK